MRPLRFAFVTTFYPPYNLGGDGIAVQRLARALVRRGHHVTVVHDVDTFRLLGGRVPEEGAQDDDGVAVVPLHSRWGALSSLITHQTGRPLLMRHRLRRLLDDGSYDVVHFHNVSQVGGPGILSFGGDAVKLYTAHEHWLVCPMHVLWRHRREPCDARQCIRCAFAHRRPPQLYRYTGYMDRQLRNVDVFIAQTEFSRTKHKEFGFAPSMQVLAQFLPDDGTLGAVPAVDQKPERPYVLFAGRLERIKGLDDVIPVFLEDVPADLWIAGDGPHCRKLKALADGSPNVRFLGLVPREQMHALMTASLAVVVPTVGFETFGLTVVEGFRAGVPVIARRQGPLPELIEQAHGGLLFDSPKELLAAVTRLHDDPELRFRLGSAGRAAFLEKWSEGVIIPKYLALVESLLVEGRPE